MRCLEESVSDMLIFFFDGGKKHFIDVVKGAFFSSFLNAHVLLNVINIRIHKTTHWVERGKRKEKYLDWKCH